MQHVTQGLAATDDNKRVYGVDGGGGVIGWFGHKNDLTIAAHLR